MTNAMNPLIAAKRTISPDSIATMIRNAERHLAKTDRIMKRLIAKHGHCPLAEREFEPFHMLANSIISQQLSTKAAATIKQRVGMVVGVPFQTDRVLSVSRPIARRRIVRGKGALHPRACGARL